MLLGIFLVTMLSQECNVFIILELSMQQPMVQLHLLVKKNWKKIVHIDIFFYLKKQQRSDQSTHL